MLRRTKTINLKAATPSRRGIIENKDPSRATTESLTEISLLKKKKSTTAPESFYVNHAFRPAKKKCLQTPGAAVSTLGNFP